MLKQWTKEEKKEGKKERNALSFICLKTIINLSPFSFFFCEDTFMVEAGFQEVVQNRFIGDGTWWRNPM